MHLNFCCVGLRFLWEELRKDENGKSECIGRCRMPGKEGKYSTECGSAAGNCLRLHVIIFGFSFTSVPISDTSWSTPMTTCSHTIWAWLAPLALRFGPGMYRNSSWLLRCCVPNTNSLDTNPLHAVCKTFVLDLFFFFCSPPCF